MISSWRQSHASKCFIDCSKCLIHEASRCQEEIRSIGSIIKWDHFINSLLIPEQIELQLTIDHTCVHGIRFCLMWLLHQIMETKQHHLLIWNRKVIRDESVLCKHHHLHLISIFIIHDEYIFMDCIQLHTDAIAFTNNLSIWDPQKGPDWGHGDRALIFHANQEEGIMRVSLMHVVICYMCHMMKSSREKVGCIGCLKD